MKVRLTTGEGRTFAAHVLALSSIVALVTSSRTLGNVVQSAAPAATGGSALLVAAVLSEVGQLLTGWAVPVWLLAAAASGVVVLDSIRAFGKASGFLSDLGADAGAGTSLLVVRLGLLAAGSFALGVSIGVVVSQIAFRAFLVVVGAQYYVPELLPYDLVLLAFLSLSALAIGSAVALVAVRPRRN
jgi:hypothetical protein